MGNQSFRNSADGILWAVDKGGPIQPETLERLLALLRERTDYPHHVAVEVRTGAVLKTIDNEDDAQETIRRLGSLPNPVAPHQLHAELETAPFRPTAEQVTTAVERRTRRSHVLDASQRRLPPCPTCRASAGDPCRTPSWRTREPHPARLAKGT